MDGDTAVQSQSPCQPSVDSGDRDQNLTFTEDVCLRPVNICCKDGLSPRYMFSDAESLDLGDLDWVMIDIKNDSSHGMNGIKSSEHDNSWFYFKQIRDGPPSGSIIIATRRRQVKGIGIGATSSI